ncbi:hypothetical protein ZIOFF_026082 [Zingiber officinale]|uniref:Uncharacterized protein n=1 Tax=Zingiber officinale TaxID=94328 RepID=A0A8J5H3I7_ZINOF|nr:hypothetical protein ZIOFF_026082 [Zingiber officinale]
MELEVMKAMGPMEEGDAVFGADSEELWIHWCIGGMINTVRESPSIRIVFLMDLSGTSTIQLIMITTILLLILSRDTSSTYFTLILLISREHQCILLRRMTTLMKLAL